MTEFRKYSIDDFFCMQDYIDFLLDHYRKKGYNATASAIIDGANVKLEKGTAFLQNVLGLKVSASFDATVSGNELFLKFGENVWSEKVIAIVIGLFICVIPAFTGLIGAGRQAALPEDIMNMTEKYLKHKK